MPDVGRSSVFESAAPRAAEPKVPQELPGQNPSERPLPDGPREVPPREREPSIERPSPAEAPGKPEAPAEAPPPREPPMKEPGEPTPVVGG